MLGAVTERAGKQRAEGLLGVGAALLRGPAWVLWSGAICSAAAKLPPGATWQVTFSAAEVCRCLLSTWCPVRASGIRGALSSGQQGQWSPGLPFSQHSQPTGLLLPHPVPFWGGNSRGLSKTLTTPGNAGNFPSLSAFPFDALKAEPPILPGWLLLQLPMIM